ncbi:MAG TPA: M28 family peptidase, partial [Bacteroidota bacterium]|nr:M28 family peptidase [Bacteroidota bacterium]
MRPLLLTFVGFAVWTLPMAVQIPPNDPRVGEIVSAISADSIRATVNALAGFGTRHTLSDTADAARGIGAARRWIKQTFERYAGQSEGRMKVEYHRTIVQPSGRIPRPAGIVNIIATLSPGTAERAGGATDPDGRSGPGLPDRVIVVSGHYDSRASDVMDSTSDAPGANDDGSGTAVVLELARVLSGYRFHSTVIFACFAGEEQGLLGSTAWAADARERGLNIHAVLNNDIVGNIRGTDGRIESTYVRVFSEALTPLDTGETLRRRISLGLENDGASRSLARYIADLSGGYVPAFRVEMIYRRDRFLRGGDQTPFHRAGYPAVRLSEAVENYDRQHQDVRSADGRDFGDQPYAMNFAYCANVARVNAAVIASLG